jgi:hypothetical protein
LLRHLIGKFGEHLAQRGGLVFDFVVGQNLGDIFGQPDDSVVDDFRNFAWLTFYGHSPSLHRFVEREPGHLDRRHGCVTNCL